MFKRKEYYYEKRMINDISGNEYPIWDVYVLEGICGHKSIATLESLGDFMIFREVYKVKYRQLTPRGMEY